MFQTLRGDLFQKKHLAIEERRNCKLTICLGSNVLRTRCPGQKLITRMSVFRAASRRRGRDPWRRTAVQPPARFTATACTARTRPAARRPCRRRRISPASPTCKTRITRTGPHILLPASIRTTRRATRSRRATVPWCRASADNRSPPGISRITLRRARSAMAMCSSGVGCKPRKL